MTIELQMLALSIVLGLVHIILNAYWESLNFELPEIADASIRPWRRWIDTSLHTPEDIVEWQQAGPVSTDRYAVGPRSTVVLVAGGAQFENSHGIG